MPGRWNILYTGSTILEVKIGHLVLFTFSFQTRTGCSPGLPRNRQEWNQTFAPHPHPPAPQLTTLSRVRWGNKRPLANEPSHSQQPWRPHPDSSITLWALVFLLVLWSPPKTPLHGHFHAMSSFGDLLQSRSLECHPTKWFHFFTP